jgi:hypothetical protein
LPGVAPAGTATTIPVALHELAVAAAVPLNVTVLVPCVAPKFVPVIVMDVPIAPEVWLRLLMVGTVDAVLDPEAHPASPVAKAAKRSRIHSAGDAPSSGR